MMLQDSYIQNEIKTIKNELAQLKQENQALKQEVKTMKTDNWSIKPVNLLLSLCVLIGSGAIQYLLSQKEKPSEICQSISDMHTSKINCEPPNIWLPSFINELNQNINTLQQMSDNHQKDIKTLQQDTITLDNNIAKNVTKLETKEHANNKYTFFKGKISETQQDRNNIKSIFNNHIHVFWSKESYWPGATTAPRNLSHYGDRPVLDVKNFKQHYSYCNNKCNISLLTM